MAIESPFLRQFDLCGCPQGNAYPLSVPIARKGFSLALERPITIICGENGCGKSTVVEAIALHCGFSFTGGSRSHKLGEEEADVSELLKYAKFSWSLKVNDGFFMRAESFFQFSSYIDALARETGKSIYRSYGGKSLHAQSHGEAFLSLFSNRIGRKGIYILDEPEAALSPQRQLALLGIVHELEKTRNAQFVIATHSPILMAYPGADLFVIEDGEFRAINFKETPHFQVMARFFADPEGYINRFLQF